MYKLIKPLLFQLEPENAHYSTVNLLKKALKTPILNRAIKAQFSLKNSRLNRFFFNLSFKNPVGLAAGFDKNGTYYRTIQHLGFGFIEMGTATPKGQPGNKKPRLFRVPSDRALINRMGFNNDCGDDLVDRLKKRKSSTIILGGNIGKNKTTPNEEAVNDYLFCFQKLFDFVDYFVVNVSSPNTPNLRALQDKAPLTHLLKTLQLTNQQKKNPKPILLKIAPDLTDYQLSDILEIAFDTDLAGLIATNTTISRNKLSISKSEIEKIGAGGLSGFPLREQSTKVIRFLVHESQQKIPIIGVGGICSPDDALEKLDAGASLIQVYSGLVYYGPSLIKDINQAILNRRQ